MRISWSQFKSFVDTRKVSIHERELDDNNYLLQAFDGPIERSCKLRNDEADYTDYVNNYQANANPTYTDTNGVPLTRYRAFANADNLKFRGTGQSGVATKNTTTNFDYKLTENRFVNGIEFVLNNQVFGDTAKFQVVDVDNILGYGAGLVLDEFGTNWNFASDTQRQGPYIIPYPALVNSGLYIRVIYNSVGTINNVDVRFNLFLHKKP